MKSLKYIEQHLTFLILQEKKVPFQKVCKISSIANIISYLVHTALYPALSFRNRRSLNSGSDCKLDSYHLNPVHTKTHFTRNTAWGAGEQLTITTNHHHEGAPLTVALMSGKRHFRLMCCQNKENFLSSKNN